MHTSLSTVCSVLQAAQGQMYTSLATGRLEGLSQEMDSVEKQKSDAINLAENLEAAQASGML